jgi:hypothetical protein
LALCSHRGRTTAISSLKATIEATTLNAVFAAKFTATPNDTGLHGRTVSGINPLTGYNGRRIQGGVEMKLKSIPLLPVLMLVLGACGDGSQPLPAVTPTSTQVLLIATPIPTPEVVIKEVPVEDLAKVQILQENVAALKEQVAQGQAANRELEWNYEATTAELMDAIKQAEETTVALPRISLQAIA